MIPVGEYIGKEMSLRISLRRGFTTEVLNMGLETSELSLTIDGERGSNLERG